MKAVPLKRKDRRIYFQKNIFTKGQLKEIIQFFLFEKASLIVAVSMIFFQAFKSVIKISIKLLSSLIFAH
jgi:hypothetical protein